MSYQIHVQIKHDGLVAVEPLFASLSDHVWFLTVSGLRCELLKAGKPTANGLGALRQVRSRGVILLETITAFDPPNSYSYQIQRLTWFGIALPIQHLGGQISIDADHVIWRSRFSAPTKFLERWLGRYFEQLFAKLIQRALRASVAR